MSDFGQPPGGGFGQPPGGGFGQPPGGGFGQPPSGGGFGSPPAGGGFGSPPAGGGFGPPPAGGGAPGGGGSASGMAIAALVLGIASWVMCGPVLSIPGAIVGKMEMGKIERGESAAAGATLAKAGFWISVANLALAGVLICIYGIMIVVGLGAAASNQGY